ncbi:helix-turn-helix transcriptional regulator [Eubacterium multiforme]|uniref:Transcriptional regulator n=1 Tax=Eubacterium multiforme TaxID=83339 RepID=A0ABT9UTL4_9FIRM|nr:helix-turn-helix domain-containing protein [Eubacterium multiforme]MDQ0149652.1 putative transcriptional regulator [Eubacterium multiforme]
MSKKKDNLIIKNRIKLARVERNITQKELAELVGVSRQTIVYIEQCKFYPSIKLSLLLGLALDKKIEELFYFFYDEGDA